MFWKFKGKLTLKVAVISMIALCCFSLTVFADDAPTVASNAAAIAEKGIALDTVWTLIAGMLVMLMQAGFAMVETGFTRAKNACNIMMKNLMDFSIGSLAYWVVGFGIMFGAGNMFFGTSGFFP